MSPLLPSKPFTMAVAVGGVPTSQYGTSPYNNFEGSSIYQDGLQPLSVDGGGQLQVGGNWQKPTGSSVPGAAVLVGGRYAGGPTFLPLNLDSSGNIIISSSVGSLTVNQGTQGTAAEGWFVELTDGTNVLGTSGHPLYVQDAILEASVALSGASITGLKYQAVAGSDGTFLRPMLTSSTGQIHVIVDSGGGTNLSVGPTGSPVPADATLIGGLDPVGGVNLYAAGVDTDNRLYVIDQVVQQAVQNTQENDTSGSGQPIDIVGGWQPSASAFYALQLDADGNLNVNVEAGGGSSSAPSATVNAAEPTTVSPIAGSDGALVRPLKVDPTGRARVVVDSLPPVQILQDEDAPYYDSVEDSVGRYAVGAYANTQAQIVPPIEALLTGTIDDLGLFRPLVAYSGDLAASLKADGVSNPPALTGALRVVMSPDPISGVISGGVLNLPTLDVNMNAVTAVPTGNSPTAKVVQVGAVYNASNQSIPLQVDINKNLLVDVAAFTALAPGQASPNSTLPGDASMVAGSDGLLMRVLLTDPRGALKVIVENDPLLDALLEGALEPIPVVVDGAPVVNAQGVLRVQEDNATLFFFCSCRRSEHNHDYHHGGGAGDGQLRCCDRSGHASQHFAVWCQSVRAGTSGKRYRGPVAIVRTIVGRPDCYIVFQPACDGGPSRVSRLSGSGSSQSKLQHLGCTLGGSGERPVAPGRSWFADSLAVLQPGPCNHGLDLPGGPCGRIPLAVCRRRRHAFDHCLDGGFGRHRRHQWFGHQLSPPG